jgi:hypothetical protein
MSGIVLLVAGLALAVVVLWSILNDRVLLVGRTTGWLAMRDDETEAKRNNGRMGAD